MNIIYRVVVGLAILQSVYAWDKVQGPPSNAEVCRRVQAYLSKNPVIIEAGTFDGTDTVELATLLPNAKIFTFEPVPELFDKSFHRVSAFSNITIYNLALSDTVGKAIMHLSEFNHNRGVVSASSSLLAPTGHLIYAPMISFDRKIEVSTTTIDDWAREHNISTIDLLKLDIQGNELNVLMASPHALSTVKAILTEVEFAEAYKDQYLFEDIKKWLEGQGFVLDCLFVDCSWFGDALFIRK